MGGGGCVFECRWMWAGGGVCTCRCVGFGVGSRGLCLSMRRGLARCCSGWTLMAFVIVMAGRAWQLRKQCGIAVYYIVRVARCV
jgi:hypothetical protein